MQNHTSSSTLILETFTVKFAFINLDALNNKSKYTASKHLIHMFLGVPSRVHEHLLNMSEATY